MKSKQPPLSVSEVFELSPGGEDSPTWVNGLIGMVSKIVRTKTKKTGQPMNICTLADDNCEISMNVFGPVNFNEGDTIEVEGTGARRTEYNGLAQVTLSKSNKVHLVREGAGAPPPKTGGRDITPPTGQKPHNDEDLQRQGAQESGGTGSAAFYAKMKNIGVLYIHCLATARKINVSLRTEKHPEMSDAHFQACVSTLFIKADREGLALNPPALKPPAAPAAPAEPPAERQPAPVRSKPQPSPDGSAFPRNDGGDEEDVPF